MYSRGDGGNLQNLKETNQPPSREILSVRLNDFQGGQPKNLIHERNVQQNQYISEQISNDPDRVQRHVDLQLKMRNPLFHEFHYKKLIEPEYQVKQNKYFLERGQTGVTNADSLDIFQQNYQARIKNQEHSKYGNNLMNYQEHPKAVDQSQNISKQSVHLPELNLSLQQLQQQPLQQQQNKQLSSRYSPQPPLFTPGTRNNELNKFPINKSVIVNNENSFDATQPQGPYQIPQSISYHVPAPLTPTYQMPPSRKNLNQMRSQLIGQQSEVQQGGAPQQEYIQQENREQNLINQSQSVQIPDNRGEAFDDPQYQQQLKQQEQQLYNQFNNNNNNQVDNLQSSIIPNNPNGIISNQSNLISNNNNNNGNSITPNSKTPLSNGLRYSHQSTSLHNIPSAVQNQYQGQQLYQGKTPLNNSNQSSQQEQGRYATPNTLNDKKMRRMYNPIVSKVSALYEPRYGVDSHWDKYEREQFKNWENKSKDYMGIVKSKNYNLNQYQEYSTGNHVYGAQKQ